MTPTNIHKKQVLLYRLITKSFGKPGSAKYRLDRKRRNAARAAGRKAQR